MERGRFGVMEGIGGCGKDTLTDFSYELLNKNGLKTMKTFEPGGVETSVKIRKLIFELKDQRLIGAEGQMAMFFTSRHFWIEYLKQWLDNGIHVISNRAHTSTGAYQGYAEGGDMNKILRISDVILGNYKPNFVIFLDISKETSLKRKPKHTNEDPFDKETSDYFDRLIVGYRKMADENWGGMIWYKVDAEQKIEHVQESVVGILENEFNQKLYLDKLK